MQSSAQTDADHRLCLSALYDPITSQIFIRFSEGLRLNEDERSPRSVSAYETTASYKHTQ